MILMEEHEGDGESDEHDKKNMKPDVEKCWTIIKNQKNDENMKHGWR